MPNDKLNLMCGCDLKNDFYEMARESKDFEFSYRKSDNGFNNYFLIRDKYNPCFNLRVYDYSKMKLFMCNPNRLGLSFLFLLLDNIFIYNSHKDFKITRMDFNVDIPIPVKRIRDSVYISRKRNFFQYVRDFYANDYIKQYNFSIGKRPEKFTAYDKIKEIRHRRFQADIDEKTIYEEQFGFDEITRLEFKRNGDKLPFRYLSELSQLKNYDPWENLNFYNVKDMLYERCRIFKRKVNTWGMQKAIKLMGKDYTRSSFMKYLVEDTNLKELVHESYYSFLDLFLDHHSMPRIELLN